MDLAKILESLSASSTSEKTASDVSSTSNGRLETALRDAMGATHDTRYKTASSHNAQPTEDLTKIAQRLASAEQEALVKEAQLYGAAVCDGFMARMGSYDGVQSTKTAAYGDNFEKFAAENPDLVQQAAELGYRETREKLSAAASENSFEKFAAENPDLVKQAAELGYHETREKIAAVTQEAYNEGYTKVASIVKESAEGCAVRGYNDTLNVLRGLR